MAGAARRGPAGPENPAKSGLCPLGLFFAMRGLRPTAAYCIGSPNDGQSSDDFPFLAGRGAAVVRFLAGDYKR